MAITDIDNFKAYLTKMIKLQGGPYYELSLLFKNSIHKKTIIENIISKLTTTSYQFEITESESDLSEKINHYIKGDIDNDLIIRTLDINIKLNTSVNRIARLFLAELSEELIKLNFWFYGSPYDAIGFNQKGIQEIDKPYFKAFLIILIHEFHPILATIAYETDCDALFETIEAYPNSVYSMKNLTIKKIQQKILDDDFFEYCWINGLEFKEEQDIEIIKFNLSAVDTEGS